MIEVGAIGDKSFETRYEWLRPGQLVQRQKECPLVFFPIAPLEYHAPHLPVGTDVINASMVTHACCRKLGKGVVRPILTIGTERELPPKSIEAFGFAQDAYIVGMDFPTRLWNSHYLPEEIFAITVAAELEILIKQGYKYIFIANSHGGANHVEVLRRLCIKYNNTSPAKLEYHMTFSDQALITGVGGHAEILETSLMIHYRPDCVDMNALPPRPVPIKYSDYSIVDEAGFTPNYDPQRIVRKDPRDSDAENGRRWFDMAVDEMAEKVKKIIVA